MAAPPSRDALGNESLADQPSNKIFRQYYTDRDFLLSPEGILKVLSAIASLVTGVVILSSDSCPGAAGLRVGGATAPLVCAGASSLLAAGAALGAPLYAPQAWLFADIILSTVMGVLLLLMAVLTMTVCEMNSVISYVHGPLGIVSSGMVTSSAVITYVSVMRVWDASRIPYEPARSPPTEQEV